MTGVILQKSNEETNRQNEQKKKRKKESKKETLGKIGMKRKRGGKKSVTEWCGPKVKAKGHIHIHI